MVDFANADLGEEVLAAGGAERFLSSFPALRDMPPLATACDAQRATLRFAQSSAAAESLSVREAARSQLDTARSRLGDASSRAAQAVSEYEYRRLALQAIADAFEENRTAVAEEEAVRKCRVIADAYINVRQTLDARENMDTVATNIEILIRQVDVMRRAGPKSLFGESLAVNKRILASVENRCVDAVIQARAAFVNVMDNEFRAFGWPMKVPQVGANTDMISNVNDHVEKLHKLQNVSEKYPFVSQRTCWHRSLSDSWAMASILRAPLARFKYHFLENYRAGSSGPDGGAGDTLSTTSSVVVDAEAAAAVDSEARTNTNRFDRPEWAADFALARISEAAPFLKEIVLDDTCTADLKFAEGFCKVFANKIAYDSDIAIRGKKNEEGADSLISHAADIAAQFDAKIRAGIVANNPIFHADDKLPSSLDILSLDENFFANWALSELRLAQTDVLASVDSLLAKRIEKAPGGDSLDLEMECADIVDRISQASRGSRGLDSQTRILTFVKRTELKLLLSVRGRLREELENCEWEPNSYDSVFRASRAAWIAHTLALALENKSCDQFYVALEKVDIERGVAGFAEGGGASVATGGDGSPGDDGEGASVYDGEVNRLRQFSDKACAAVTNTIADQFMMSACADYQNLVRFGEISAPNAAIVLAHDLSEELCAGMGQLEGCIGAVADAVSNRKIASSVWRPAAAKLDLFFFEDVILQAWTGGVRNAVSAASSANAYMVASSAAKMARQIAHDASVLVNVFGKVTNVPKRWLGRCHEAGRLLRLGATRVLRPRAACRQEDEELFASVLDADMDAKDDGAKQLRESVDVLTLTVREARECLVVAGMYEVLPME